MHATTIGVDLAKRVFEVAVADGAWRIVARHRYTRSQFERFLRRGPAGHVVMEACATAHYWGRTAQALGHRVTLLPARYVRPYVRRNKTDRSDAEAVLEAVRCGALHPVPVKTVAQQDVLAVHRVRAQWMTTRTARINAMRALLLEFGVAVATGARVAMRSIPTLVADADCPIPPLVRDVVQRLYEEVRGLEDQIAALERVLDHVAADDPIVQRLLTIPGIGVLTATALVGTIGRIEAFGRAREFAGWLGLTPRERSSGNHRRLGGITKQGDRYLRCLLTHGARAVLQAALRKAKRRAPEDRLEQWALQVRQRRGTNKATVAVANKLARIVWAVWSREGAYTAHVALPEAA